MIADLSIVVPTFNERANVPKLVELVSAALQGVAWEMIVVDDDSPDGTSSVAKELAQHDERVRCIRRVNRRGLSGACVEGILSSSAPVVAVMDADLQHDESILPRMYERMRSGEVDLVVGSRYVAGGSADAGFSSFRAKISRWATALARRALHADFNDLMSGFFMVQRDLVEKIAPQLADSGFKILADIVASAGHKLRIEEIAFKFRERTEGESKLDAKVGLDFLGLILNKSTGGLLPIRFIYFALVGVTGVLVHMATLRVAMALFEESFVTSQTIAVVVAMTSNFFINNAFTYRDARLKGMIPVLRGLILFYIVCAIGAVANVGIASWTYDNTDSWFVAALIGVAMGSVWNFALSSFFVWRKS
ncbi:MAG: glycosyltransferase family 2 protein [Hyphomicrobiales bacterium]|nr:glycosyltransferase family 2 protein [Hyphomicrobiales bacterium]